MMTDPFEHGGNLDDALSVYGGSRDEWCDLSTGINPFAYPFQMPDTDKLSQLPDRQALERLETLARSYYQISNQSFDIMAVAGAQMAISTLCPLLAGKLAHNHPEQPASAAILSPTYNEYERCLKRTGMAVSHASEIKTLFGAELAVICSPNNPTGIQLTSGHIHEVASHTEYLILDESFADMTDISPYSAEQTPAKNSIILKSFGKFFGLAGLRLGFVIGAEDFIAALREHIGPWPVSGMAIEIAIQAFSDSSWHASTCASLRQLSDQMDHLAVSAGLSVLGGTPLFRLYQAENASAFQHHLAQYQLWSRCFSYAPDWIRLGIAPPADMPRLEQAFNDWHMK